MTARRRRALWEALLEHVGPRPPKKKWTKAVDPAFTRMADGLEKVVESAVCKATEDGSVRNWRWDPDDGYFRFEVYVVLRSKVATPAITVSCPFRLDPHYAWRDEVERVMIEAEQFVRLLRESIERVVV